MRIILPTCASEIPSERESSGMVRLSPSPARPTRRRHRSPYSSCEVSFMVLLSSLSTLDSRLWTLDSLSHHPELQLRRIRHHLEAPWRIEDHLYVRFPN